MLKLNTMLMGIVYALALSVAPVLAMGEMHPYFTIKHILPSAMNKVFGLGGIDLLPNGDGVICIWGGSQKTIGEVWIVPGLASGTPGTPTLISKDLREPLGVKVVGSDFYVMEKPRILKFVGSGTTWTKSTLWSLPTAWYNDTQWHHFSFNLVFKENAFWFTTGTAYDYDPKDPQQRGALIRVPLDGSGFTQMARGLRNTNGIGIGPDDEFFVTENEGHWKPVNMLYWIPTVAGGPKDGRFYGFRTNGNNACGITAPKVDGTSCPNDPEYPPAIYIPKTRFVAANTPRDKFSNSPTRPILIKAGPYAGQLISGDVNFGGTWRYFVEKVNGEYQGALFPFMEAGPGGVNFGINQFLYTPTGSLLVAGIGGGDVCGTAGSDNWNWNSTCRGLDLLTPTTTTPFEILAVRSAPGGFEIEFTKPAGAAAATAGNYQVRTTVYTPVQKYGEDSSGTDNDIGVAVNSVTMSSDNRRATLKMASLKTKRMYAFVLDAKITGAANEQLFNNLAFYTLNSVATATAIQAGDNFPGTLKVSVSANGNVIGVPFNQAYRLGLFSADGSKVKEFVGDAPKNFDVSSTKPGLYLLSGHVAGRAWQRKVFLR